MSLLKKLLGLPPQKTDVAPAFNSCATLQDVESCYRLLLGRAPDPAGLRHFKTAVESNSLCVADLVDGFLKSSEFKQLQSSRSQVSVIHRSGDVQAFAKISAMPCLPGKRKDGLTLIFCWSLLARRCNPKQLLVPVPCSESVQIPGDSAVSQR
jgi:hypothetical protein